MGFSPAQCPTECIVYKATLTANDDEVKTYIGLTETPFKKRLYKHSTDRRDRNLEQFNSNVSILLEEGR